MTFLYSDAHFLGSLHSSNNLESGLACHVMPFTPIDGLPGAHTIDHLCPRRLRELPPVISVQMALGLSDDIRALGVNNFLSLRTFPSHRDAS